MTKRTDPAADLRVGGVAILVSLGVWQVQRLAWKEGVLAEIEARIAAAPVALPEAPDPEADRYLPVADGGAILGRARCACW
jgi:surfeit locus 1 family protein